MLDTGETYYQLPSRESIIERLSANDKQQNLVSQLYPEIANKLAEEEVTPDGLAVRLATALQTVVTKNGWLPGLHMILMLKIPAWIRALVDDSSFAEKAIKEYKDLTTL